MSISPPSAKSGLCVTGSQNWKLDWNDAYEWGALCGFPDEALAGIRSRIRWLKARDYNHPLLFQPTEDSLFDSN